MIHKFLRLGLGSISLALLLSCGGGSDGTNGTNFASGVAGNGPFMAAAGSGSDGSPGGDGTGAGTGSVGGGDGSTSTAANGNGDSGVGSGGTGVSADASTSVGSVDGMGSIFVGDLRYDTDRAVLDVRDAAQLQIGMTVAVTGPVDTAFASGTALQVMSMAQLRGPAGAVHPSDGSFELLGATISVDPNTVWADLGGLAGLSTGMPVQVWALPLGPGQLRATRIETRSIAATTLVTGMVAQLDTASGTFRLGGLLVDYRAASLPAGGLANGRIVRVSSALAPAGGLLVADKVDGWYALPGVKGASVQLEGVINEFVPGGASFNLMGTPVDASAAAVAGGPQSKLGNGVTVVASGVLSNAGVLVASKLRIRHIPGGGALPSFSLIGPISNYNSPADMMVRGQRVDASAAAIVGNGQLANGVRVSVQGSELVNNVLRVTQLRFE